MQNIKTYHRHWVIALYILLSLITDSTAEDFDTRRVKLLEMLTSPKMLAGDIDSGGYSYRRGWQYYNACLARGIRLTEANRYFAESDDLAAEEWHVLMYIRTYFTFKDTTLSPKACERLAAVMLDYKNNSYRSKGIENFGTNGNHSIVNFSMYLLLDQEFGNGPKHAVVRDKFIDWVQYQGKYGRDEVNSPHYLDRSLLPLLNIYDFSEDKQLKRWAQLAIDQMVADFAVLNLKNVRGGPWCRAHQGHTKGVAEHNDGTQDSFYVAGYQFFGGISVPAYLQTHQILNYGFVTTTDYRPPEVMVELFDSEDRAPYEYRSHRRPVRSSGTGYYPLSYHEWDMYYYITPAYSLGSVQDRVELDNHVTGRITRDFVNTQVWELTFANPNKIMGPKRNLNANTGQEHNVTEVNSNTANMQYKNVLFYKGKFLDYNHNLQVEGGTYSKETYGNKEFCFWRIPTSAGDVYVGITHFPAAGAGILEVVQEREVGGFEAFQEAVRSTLSACKDAGRETLYTSTKSDTITYTNTSGKPNRGEATVNGEAWSLHEYPLYDSPYIRSGLASGVIRIIKGKKSLLLDFRDRDSVHGGQNNTQMMELRNGKQRKEQI